MAVDADVVVDSSFKRICPLASYHPSFSLRNHLSFKRCCSLTLCTFSSQNDPKQLLTLIQRRKQQCHGASIANACYPIHYSEWSVLVLNWFLCTRLRLCLSQSRCCCRLGRGRIPGLDLVHEFLFGPQESLCALCRVLRHRNRIIHPCNLTTS